jgi:hypothetical protein
LEIPPPNINNGRIDAVIRAIFHDKHRAIIKPTNKVDNASIIIEILSVDNPFNNVISSEITLLKTPGALSLESNH